MCKCVKRVCVCGGRGGGASLDSLVVVPGGVILGKLQDVVLQVADLHLLGRLQQQGLGVDALLLDARSAEEFATGHLPGALNIPHTELRGRLDEVRATAAGRPVRVLCASGVRSAIAHRVLTQAGFDSASLSGGMLTLRATLGDRAARLLDPTTLDPAPVGA